jgi:hypothetical protein
MKNPASVRNAGLGSLLKKGTGSEQCPIFLQISWNGDVPVPFFNWLPGQIVTSRSSPILPVGKPTAARKCVALPRFSATAR